MCWLVTVQTVGILIVEGFLPKLTACIVGWITLNADQGGIQAFLSSIVSLLGEEGEACAVGVSCLCKVRDISLHYFSDRGN